MNNCTPYTLTRDEIPAHMAAVRRYLTGRLRPDEVADAVQSVLERAIGMIADFRGDSAPQTWLIGIARFVGLEVARARQVALARNPGEDAEGEQITSETIAAPDAEVETSAEANADRARMLAAMTRLTPSERAILLAAYVAELPGPEAAAALGLADAAYRQRLNRARQSLARALDALRTFSTRQCAAMVERWREEQADEASVMDRAFAEARGHAVVT